MKRYLAPIRIVPLLLGIAVTCSGSAWGRAQVVESIPADGEALARAPDAVVLRFSGEIKPGLTRLFLSDRSGLGFPLPAQPKVSGPTDRLSIVLPPLPRGSYILRYRVIDTSGEATFGSVTFTAAGY